MTIGLKLRFAGGSCIGTCTAIVHDHMLLSMVEPKTTLRSGLAWCVAGDTEHYVVLRNQFDPPTIAAGESVEHFITVTVADAMRRCLVRQRRIKRDQGLGHTEILVVFRHRAWRLTGNFVAVESARPYNAIGSGAVAALGALHATDGLDLHPLVRVQRALEAAQQFDTWVRGPFHILTLPDGQFSRYESQPGASPL